MNSLSKLFELDEKGVSVVNNEVIDYNIFNLYKFH